MIRFSKLVPLTTTSFLNNTVNNTTKCSNKYFFNKLFGDDGSSNQSTLSSTTPTNREMTKVLNYPVNQVYNVVLKVEEYKDFLPFCLESKIILKSKDYFDAELQVGQGAIKESYTSRVVYIENQLIESTATDTPLFHKLVNKWTFKNGDKPNTCIANCKLSYQFKSPFYATIMDKFFASSLDVMINSFEKRCEELYGNNNKK